MSIKCHGIFECPNVVHIILILLLIEVGPPMFCSVAPKMASIISFVIGPNPNGLFQVIDVDCCHNIFQISFSFWNIKGRISAFLGQTPINCCLSLDFYQIRIYMQTDGKLTYAGIRLYPCAFLQMAYPFFLMKKSGLFEDKNDVSQPLQSWESTLMSLLNINRSSRIGNLYSAVSDMAQYSSWILKMPDFQICFLKSNFELRKNIKSLSFIFTRRQSLSSGIIDRLMVSLMYNWSRMGST